MSSGATGRPPREALYEGLQPLARGPPPAGAVDQGDAAVPLLDQVGHGGAHAAREIALDDAEVRRGGRQIAIEEHRRCLEPDEVVGDLLPAGDPRVDQQAIDPPAGHQLQVGAAEGWVVLGVDQEHRISMGAQHLIDGGVDRAIGHAVDQEADQAGPAPTHRLRGGVRMELEFPDRRLHPLAQARAHVGMPVQRARDG